MSNGRMSSRTAYRWERYVQGEGESWGPARSPICMTGSVCSTQWPTGLHLGGPLGGQTMSLAGGAVLVKPAGVCSEARKDHVSSGHFNSHTPHPRMPEFPLWISLNCILSQDERASLPPPSAARQAPCTALHYSWRFTLIKCFKVS